MAKTEWLPHLKNSIPDGARGYTVSMYAIALEGWRRGLTLKFINKNRRKSETIYTLSSSEKEHHFTVSFGDKNTNEARKFCKDKHKTKQRLLEEGVSTPQGELFVEGTPDEEIISYAEKLGYPLVLKPSDGTGGKGVIANIKNYQEFVEALTYVKGDLKQTNVIVEKYFAGKDHRIYVVGDKVIGAYTRMPANVIGDGKRNVKQLLQSNMKERNNNPALFRRTIKVDKEMKNMLKEKGYTMESIPKKDERVYLKSKSNVSAGGESVDVTDNISDAVKDIAINAVAAIPGLQHAGVDLMINSEGNDGVVLEINTQASINSHLYPMEGKARDIPKALIDLYFPETISKYEKNANRFYFDYPTIYSLFQMNVINECTVSPVPTGDITSSRLEIQNIDDYTKYASWVKKQAINNKINGYIKKLVNGIISVVISGEVSNSNKFKKKLIDTNLNDNKDIIEKTRKSPVKMGFDVLSDFNQKNKGNENSVKVLSSITEYEYKPVTIEDVRKKLK